MPSTWTTKTSFTPEVRRNGPRDAAFASSKEDRTWPSKSTTESREAPKVQGKFTHEQQKRVINKEENATGTDATLPGETLKRTAMRYPKPGPGSADEMSTGHREIQRGASDESEHRKRRSDD